MEPVRPLRDVFAGLAGADGEQAGDALAAAGHEGLPDDLVATAIADYARTAPVEVAEHLAPYVVGDGDAPPADGLSLLATAPTGPWDDEAALDGPDGTDAIDGIDGARLGGLDAADRLDGTDAPGQDDDGLDEPADPFGAGHTGARPGDPGDHLDGSAALDLPTELEPPAELDGADGPFAPPPGADPFAADPAFGAGAQQPDLEPDDGPDGPDLPDDG